MYYQLALSKRDRKMLEKFQSLRISASSSAASSSSSSGGTVQKQTPGTVGAPPERKLSSLSRIGTSFRYSFNSKDAQGILSPTSQSASAESTVSDQESPKHRQVMSMDYSPKRRGSSFSGARLTSFESKLDQALLKSQSSKKELLSAAKRQFAEESLLLYEAIRRWEMERRAPTRRRIQDAKRIIATYITPGSVHENGCISGSTRVELDSIMVKIEEGEMARPPSDLFEFVKQEVLSDIFMNTTIKTMVESICGTPSQSFPQKTT